MARTGGRSIMEILIAIPFFALVVLLARMVDRGNPPFHDDTDYLCPSCGRDIMDPCCGFIERDECYDG
jgi:hypothetical protein